MSKVLIVAALLLTGCASAHNPADPIEPVNRGVYKFNDKLDKAVIKPVAQGYDKVMPVVAKTMVSSFFSNLDDITVTLNDLLQFNFKQGFSDGVRVFVNTTIGVFGLVDVASKNGGPQKHNTDFGQTLGKWGVGNGPYVVLPILGPSTVRDTAGIYTDMQLPSVQTDVPTRNELYVAKGISKRAGLLDGEKILQEAEVGDPYTFTRNAYLQHRQSQLYDGNPPKPNYDDE